MSTRWDQTPEERRRWRLFNGVQHDPTREHRRVHGAGRPYFRPRSRGVLMPDSFMPVGSHQGKHMRAVPASYLLWVDAQPWSRQWAGWSSVHDFIQRFILPDHDSNSPPEIPDVPLHLSPALDGGRGPCISRLHTVAECTDHLHAFAAGALGLNPTWYHPRATPPHYPLSHAKHKTALQFGATLIQ